MKGNMMNTFSATFSNGNTVTRKSEHPYRYAIGLVNKTTGELVNVKFTATENKSPDWTGIAKTVRSGFGISQRDADRINRECMEERKNWNVEIIKL